MALVPLEEILSKVSNVYEAVIVAAKRARQINELRLQEQPNLSDEEASEDEERLEEIERRDDEVDREKVTVKALRDLANGKIDSYYQSKKE